MRLHEFQQKHIDHFVAALLPGRARKTVNNITAVLSSLMKYAGRSKLIDSDGLKDLRFDIESQKPEMQAVSADEILRMMKVTTDIRYRVAILLAADAGLRIGEIRALTWENVNELQREITISQSVDRTNALGAPKGWKTRTVPISERLWAELQTLDKVSPWVVPRLKGDMSKPLGYETTRQAILGIYDRAKVTKPTKQWHGLRHSFGTGLASSGVPVHVIQELMGHKSIDTTLGYMHTDRDAKRQAIAALGVAANGIAAPQKEKIPLTN